MSPRRFLFLQGPHGPFFAQLAAALRDAGHLCWRVGFNGGDRAFWPGAGYIPHRAAVTDWPARLARILAERDITDLVLYGDTRPIHAEALQQARTAGLRCHIFEEGYLRPHWVTYERHGANAGSRLMHLPLDTTPAPPPTEPPPDRWGDMRQHAGYSVLYHLCVAFSRAYPAYRSHRGISVWTEARLNLQRLLAMPLTRVGRWRASRRVTRAGRPYHMVLLQLAHDANFRDHAPFANQAALVEHVTRAFAKSAPAHHLLVFKAHPFEDSRENLRRVIHLASARYDLQGRVHFVNGGKLAPLLDDAQTAVTVNSTAGHQALWRGLPLCALGAAIYRRPGLASDQPLEAFFANPLPPDPEAYRAFRHVMLRTSQIPGSFYAARGRHRLLRQITDRFLANEDAYDAMLDVKPESTGPQLSLVQQ